MKDTEILPSKGGTVQENLQWVVEHWEGTPHESLVLLLKDLHLDGKDVTQTGKELRKERIPSFYTPKIKAGGSKATSADSVKEEISPDTAAREIAMNLLKKLIIEERIERVENLLLSSDDLSNIWKVLEICGVVGTIVNPMDGSSDGNAMEGKFLQYKHFRAARASLPAKFAWFFQPSIFIQMYKFPIRLHATVNFVDEGKDGLSVDEKKIVDGVAVHNLYSFISRAAALVEALFTLTNYSRERDGYLAEEELQTYLEDMMPHLNLHHPSSSVGGDNTLRKFYICTCLRKFSFHHDKLRQGRLSINALVFSQTLSELHELRDPDLSPDLVASNWFSTQYTSHIYTEFLKMDTDRNGMLSKKELASKYRGGNLTKAFVDRVYSCVQLFGGEMDFLVYLDFCLAMEGIGSGSLTEQNVAIAWLFGMLDVKCDGFLDESVVMYFVKDVVIRMFAAGMESISRTDVVNEIFDMANPVEKDKITLKDLQNCGAGGSIVNMLVDFMGFHTYDSRSSSE